MNTAFVSLFLIIIVLGSQHAHAYYDYTRLANSPIVVLADKANIRIDDLVVEGVYRREMVIEKGHAVMGSGVEYPLHIRDYKYLFLPGNTKTALLHLQRSGSSYQFTSDVSSAIPSSLSYHEVFALLDGEFEHGDFLINLLSKEIDPSCILVQSQVALRAPVNVLSRAFSTIGTKNASMRKELAMLLLGIEIHGVEYIRKAPEEPLNFLMQIDEFGRGRRLELADSVTLEVSKSLSIFYTQLKQSAIKGQVGWLLDYADRYPESMKAEIYDALGSSLTILDAHRVAEALNKSTANREKYAFVRVLYRILHDGSGQPSMSAFNNDPEVYVRKIMDDFAALAPPLLNP